MATNLPVRVEDYTAIQAQSTYTKAEKAAFKELAVFHDEFIKHNIWWYWDLGQKIGKIYKAAKDDHDLYGKEMLKRLAIGLGYRTDGQLRGAMRVVDLWQTKKAFSQYVQLRGEAGNRLSWSHISHLSKIADDKSRLHLAAVALEQCWPAADLWERVKALTINKPRGAGRPPKTKIPATAGGCLTHVLSQARKFVANHDDAWTGGAFDIRSTIRDIPADKLNDDLLEAVVDTKRKLDEMRTCAEDFAATLAVTAADIRNRMALQAQHELDVAAEESAEAATEETVETPTAPPASKRKPAKKKGKKRRNRVGVTA